MDHLDSYNHFIKSTFLSRLRFRNFLNDLRDNNNIIFDKTKTIMLHPHVVYDDDYFKVAIEYLTKKLYKLGFDSKIFFYHPDEGFSIRNIIFYDKITKHLINLYNIPVDNFFYATGAAGTELNKKKYKQYCKEFDFIPLNVIYINSFESNHYVTEDDWLYYQKNNPINYTDRKIEKKFVCLNGRPRPHRLAILGEIVKRNLRKDCFLSFALRDHEVPITNFLPILTNLLPKTSKSISENVSKISHEFPLFLTMKDPDGLNMHVPNSEDIKMYRASLFSLVNETVFFTNKEFYGDIEYAENIMCFPCTFLTEKTWNCVKVKHPFILCHTPYALEGFRELGYKTFSPFIDESYDRIEDDQDRITAIMNEVERLCNMNDDQVKEWLKGVTEICEYNHHVLLYKTLPTIIMDSRV